MTIWMRVFNDVTSAIGTERSRTADLFTVFWTKSAMVGYSSPARLPGNMTDNHKVCPWGYEPDFIGRLALSRSHRKSAAQWVLATEAFPITGYRLEMF